MEEVISHDIACQATGDQWQLQMKYSSKLFPLKKTFVLLQEATIAWIYTSAGVNQCISQEVADPVFIFIW